MNVKEGTRRLALLFGVIGAIAGGVASYATLSDAMEARAHYKAFERLATSDAVEQERNYLLSLHLSAADVPDSTNFMTLDMSTYQPNGGGPPPGAVATPIAPTPNPARPLPPLPPGAVIVPNPYAGIGKPVGLPPSTGMGDVFDQAAAQAAAAAAPEPIASAARKEGIKSIVWNKNLEVQSIEKVDGDVVISEQQPSLWTYLLVVLFPVAGFVIPWGAIRALMWVGYGFTESPK